MKKMILDYLNYEIDEDGNVYNTTTKTYLKGSVGENGYKYYRLSKNNTKTPHLRGFLLPVDGFSCKVEVESTSPKGDF